MGGPNKKVNFREKEKQILDKILGPAHYDRRIRPSGVNGTGFFLFFQFISISFADASGFLISAPSIVV